MSWFQVQITCNKRHLSQEDGVGRTFVAYGDHEDTDIVRPNFRAGESCGSGPLRRRSLRFGGRVGAESD